MLKVETTKKETIDPKDLTDSHFIGVIFTNGAKGFIHKIKHRQYVYAVADEFSNDYHQQAVRDSIDTMIGDTMKEHPKVQFFATLDYQEFKDWYFKQ